MMFIFLLVYNRRVVNIYLSDEKSEPPEKINIKSLPQEDNNTGIFSDFIRKFIVKHTLLLNTSTLPGDQTIRFSEVLGSLARLYERIRNVVEFKGEYVLRRNATERILKRLLWTHGGKESEKISLTLIKELVWAHYLPNGKIAKTKTKEIAVIIEKYLSLIAVFVQKGSGIKLADASNWVWGVASAEIEEALDETGKEDYVQLMYEWFKNYYEWTDTGIPEEDKDIQIYLAIQRAYIKSDTQFLRYRLLLHKYPTWIENNQKLIEETAINFNQIYTEIENILSYPKKLSLYRIVKKQVAPFEIFKSIAQDLGNNLVKVLSDEGLFEKEIEKVCHLKYMQIKEKVNRGILRGIIYIFITKVVLALIIEVPYELYRFSNIRYIPLFINILIPPSFMWFIGLSIKVPAQENTQILIAKLKTVVYKSNTIPKIQFSLEPVKRDWSLVKIFSAFYFILFLLVFGGLTFVLISLNFTYLGILIFFSFLSLVLLFGFRVRSTASELNVTTGKQGFFTHLIDNLTLPFLSAGIYLSQGLAKINFFSILLDFLIEAPLKSIIEIVGEWTSFIREKKEQAIEVPE